MVAFGELLLRLDTPGNERFVQAGRFTARFTGAEANAAVALAQWGVDAFAVSKVPDNEIGQACVNFLRRYGVKTCHILRGGPRLGVLFIETGASQRPTKVLYDRAGSSFSCADPGEYDWPAILKGKQWFHFSGTAPALGPGVLAALKAGLAEAKQRGITISFDCNYRSTLWPLERAKPILRELLGLADVFIGTPYDATLIFGIKGTPASSARALARKYSLKAVAYTLRKGNSASFGTIAGLLFEGHAGARSREYEMKMVDRIGGGDAFSAGIIYGMLSGWDVRKTVNFAAASSCLKHSIPGDFVLATMSEIEEVTATGGASRVKR